MVEQVLVHHAVHAPVAQHQLYVLVELLAHGEAVVQPLHQALLLGRELVGILRVDGGEVAGCEFVFHLVHFHRSPLEVDGVEQLAVVHVPSRVSGYHGGFKLPLYHADGLVHTGQEQFVFLVEGVFLGYLGHELHAGVVAVGVHGEGCQLDEVDAVAVLQRLHVGIAQGYANDVAHAGVVAGGRSHPQDVVVAPGDVPSVVALERVHHDVGARPAVVDVAEDVELVYAEPLNHAAQGDDEVVGAAGGYDGLDDGAHVVGLVLVFRMLVEELLDDVGEVDGERLAHLRAGVLARHVAAHVHQVVDGDVVPVLDVALLLLHQFQLLLGIVDERAELTLLIGPEGVAKEVVHLALDVARGVFQHVLESLVFAVDVGQEMLRAFWQVEDGTEVDDFSTGVGNSRKRLREQLQIPFVLL